MPPSRRSTWVALSAIAFKESIRDDDEGGFVQRKELDVVSRSGVDRFGLWAGSRNAGY